MKTTSILALVFSIILGSVCASGQNAKPQVTRLEVQDFSQLQVSDPVNVIYRNVPDSAGYAVFETTPDVIPHLIFTNNKNKLRIQVNDANLIKHRLPTITVYSNFLTQAENSSDSTLLVDSPAPASFFKARIIGNGTLVVRNLHTNETEGKLDTGKGHLVLTGVTRNVKLSNVGTGQIEAGGLEAETGTITVLGTGPTDVNVSTELSVKGLGTGKVYLKGKPNVKNRTLGSVKVINVE